MKRDMGFVKIRRGLREHLVTMSSNAVKLYLWLHLSANWAVKRGCVEASYEDIARALGWSQKTLQRTVAELEPKYIAVAHANQFKLTTIRIIKYDIAVDNSVQSASAVDTVVDKFVQSDVHSDPSKPATTHELQAPKKAVEGIEGKKEKEPAAKTTPHGDPRHKLFFDFAYESFRMKYLQPPTWGAPHGKALQGFLREHTQLALEEWKRRYLAFLASTVPFYRQQHGDLKFFVSKFDSFIDGPIVEKGSTNGKPTATDHARQQARALGVN